MMLQTCYKLSSCLFWFYFSADDALVHVHVDVDDDNHNKKNAIPIQKQKQKEDENENENKNGMDCYSFCCKDI